MRISVAICTYNGGKFITEQIDSILNQSLKADEIVVCDDGSTDSTIEILNEYSKSNPNLFKIYCNKINLKSVKNFEKAINLCSGNYIFLADQDDIWSINKIEKYIQYFEQNPKIEVLASNGFCIDEKSIVHEKYAIWDVPNFLKENSINFDYFSLIAYFSNVSTGASMAIRKSFVKNILPFPIIKNFHHDEWIAINAAKYGSFELLKEKYFFYRIHENQQVGSVFFDKSKKTKEFLTDFADFKSNQSSFKIYKKRLRKISSFYELNKKLIEMNFNDTLNFNENLENSINLYKVTKLKMIKKHPIRSLLLNLSDKIFNKRKMKF